MTWFLIFLIYAGKIICLSGPPGVGKTSIGYMVVAGGKGPSSCCCAVVVLVGTSFAHVGRDEYYFKL